MSEKKRWSQVLKIVLGSLGVDYTRVRTEIVDLLRRNSECCVTVNNQETPTCIHNVAVKSGLPLTEPSDPYAVLALALNYMVLGEDAKGCSTLIQVFKQLGRWFHDISMNKFSPSSSSSSSSVAAIAKMSCVGRITNGSKKMRIDEDVKKDLHQIQIQTDPKPSYKCEVSLLDLLPTLFILLTTHTDLTNCI
jgi:hypothetical protein